MLVLLLLIVVSALYCMKKPGSQRESIQKQLKAMVAEDQDLRLKVDYAQFDTALWEQIHAIDRKNTAVLKDILQSLPEQWPIISAFGEEADNDAWLLVQHADLDPAFQKEVLTRLEKLCLKKETSCKNTAYLYDRVAMAENRPQRYGTQFHLQDGVMVPYEIEDSENIDMRRKAVGLSTFKEYEDKLKEVTKTSK